MKKLRTHWREAALIGSAVMISVGLAGAVNNPLWTDEEGARKTLENAGLTPVEIGGYGWFNCDRGNLWKTKFVARNSNGDTVKGLVCDGVFKTPTIEYAP